MACFLACFGSSKDRESRKQRHKVRPRTRHQTHGSYKSVEATVIEPDRRETTHIEFATSLPQDNKSEDQLGLSARKKVTFDLNVTTYEHVSESEIEDNKSGEAISKTEDEEKKLNSGKWSQLHSISEQLSVSSSFKSCPPNHRYLNCRDSDDEDEETDEFEDDDFSENGLDDDTEECYNKSIENQPLPWVESMNLNTNTDTLGNHGPESMKSKRMIRDRSAYVHPVLNPVENLTQWKALKEREGPQLKQQQLQQPKFELQSERLPKHEEELSFSSRTKRGRDWRARNCHTEGEVAVDASLSSWLGAAAVSDNSASSVSKSPARSFEDRPILGALTVEELRQFSASSSPLKRSPCRSADEEAPIIGSVGGYWGQQQHALAAKGSPASAASSFKGIPNTTSKYREDKLVKWHSTPFETRLERALERGAADV